MGIFHSIATRTIAGRRFVFKASAVALAAFSVAMLLQTGKANAGGYTGPATVSVSRLNLRQSASAKSRVVAVLRKGDAVQVTEVSGNWCKAATTGGNMGWCLSRYLSFSTVEKDIQPVSFAFLDTPSQYISLSQAFTYACCMEDMDEIAAAYADRARVETIGYSVMGNPIKAIVLGNPAAGKKILVQASMHAREGITSLLALRQAECILKAASTDTYYRKAKVSGLLDDVEIWVVPMSNPDGVRLVYEGLNAVPDPGLAAALKAMNHGSTDFRRWKANAHGVDLNRNFAGHHWTIDPEYPMPGMQNYSGPEPFSEPESIALRDLTVAQNFCMTMSYHSSGMMIYWYDEKYGPRGVNKYVADDLRVLNGYRVLPVSAQDPGGGYRDWYVEEFGMPGITMEIGSGYCPLPLSSFSGIWGDNRFILYELAWLAGTKNFTP